MLCWEGGTICVWCHCAGLTWGQMCVSAAALMHAACGGSHTALQLWPSRGDWLMAVGAQRVWRCASLRGGRYAGLVAVHTCVSPSNCRELIVCMSSNVMSHTAATAPAKPCICVTSHQTQMLVDHSRACRPPQILPPGANPLEPFQGPGYYFFKCARSRNPVTEHCSICACSCWQPCAPSTRLSRCQPQPCALYRAA